MRAIYKVHAIQSAHNTYTKCALYTKYARNVQKNKSCAQYRKQEKQVARAQYTKKKLRAHAIQKNTVRALNCAPHTHYPALRTGLHALPVAAPHARRRTPCRTPRHTPPHRRTTTCRSTHCTKCHARAAPGALHQWPAPAASQGAIRGASGGDSCGGK